MRRRLAAVLLAAVWLLTGCWDYRRLTSVDFAMGMAIDSSSTGGLRLTLQFPRPEAQRDRGENFHLVEGQGRSFADALSNLQRQLSRPLTFGHLQALLISSAVVEHRGEQLLEQLWRFAEMDKACYIFLVTDGDASDILKQVPPHERLTSLYLAGAMESLHQTRTAVAPTTLIKAMIQANEPGRDPEMAVVDLREGHLIIERMAVFRHARPAVVLSPEESMALVIAMGALRNGTLTVERSSGELWAFRRIRSVSSHVQVAEGPRLALTVRLRGEIEGVGAVGQHIEPELEREMERVVAERFRMRLVNTLRRLQTLEVDPLGFLARQRATLPAGDGWRQIYRRAPLTVTVQMELRRKGAGD